MTTMVIGSTSMIGRVLQRHEATAGWSYLSHAQVLADPELLTGMETVVNLAYNPRLKISPYSPSLDFDLWLAARLADSSARYVMTSTRMVYGLASDDIGLHEGVEPVPTTPYGISKRETERRLTALLGDRLTVLRLSNVFDPLEAEENRRSFFGMALRSLKRSGCILFDMSPFVQRDFLPASVLAERIAAVVAHPRPGLFNMGAGFAVPTGRIAQWVIEGHGTGELVITDFRDFDSFRLDMTKTHQAWNMPAFTKDALRAFCRSAGTQLGTSVVLEASAS